MIKAQLKERYIFSSAGIKRAGTKDLVLETRYFTNMTAFHAWLDTFKDQLWEDDGSKVDLVEGIYVVTEEVVLDDVTPPKKLRRYATFRKGVSQYYAA